MLGPMDETAGGSGGGNGAAGGKAEARLGLALLALVAIAVAAGYWARAALRGNPAAPGNRRLAPFELAERGGRTVRDGDLAGRVLVVSFVYTSCNVSCREVSVHMAGIQRRVAAHDDVQLVSFAVDPETDTPAVLARWGEQFGADPARWWFLTGPKASVHGLIERSFLTRDPMLRGVMPGEFADADHIAVVDRAGRVRAYFDGTRPGVEESVAALVGRLRDERR